MPIIELPCCSKARGLKLGITPMIDNIGLGICIYIYMQTYLYIYIALN